MRRDELREKLAPVRCFLLDMDGTVYLGGRLLPGALDFLRAARESGRSALFLTNNSSKSAANYVEKLRVLGIDVGPEAVLTSGQATAEFVRARFPDARAFVLGTAALVKELADGGVDVDPDHPDLIIVGYDTTLDYAKMNRVCALAASGVPMIATHPDFVCPVEGGFAPDIGAILAFIEAATGARPVDVVGKPNRHMLDTTARRIGCAIEGMCMVGDRLYTDIAMGRHGILTALVLSGETSAEMLAKSEYRPDIVAGGIGELVEGLA